MWLKSALGTEIADTEIRLDQDKVMVPGEQGLPYVHFPRAV